LKGGDCIRLSINEEGGNAGSGKKMGFIEIFAKKNPCGKNEAVVDDGKESL